MYFLYQIRSGFTNTYLSHFAAESAGSQVDTNTEEPKNTENPSDAESDIRRINQELQAKILKKREAQSEQAAKINPNLEKQDSNTVKTPESIAAADGIEGIDDIDEAREYIAALKASESIVSTHITVLGNFLEKVVAGKIEGLSKDDPEFIELQKHFSKKMKEYKGLSDETKVLDMRLQVNQINDLGDALVTKTENTNQKEEEKSKIEGVEYDESIKQEESDITQWENEGQETKQKANEVMNVMNGKIDDSEMNPDLASEIYKEYGYSDIVGVVNTINEEGGSDPKTQERIQKYTQLLNILDKRGLVSPEGKNLKSILEKDFLENVKHDDRVQYFSEKGVGAKDLKEGMELTISYRFEGELNRELSNDISAGEALPVNVSELTVGQDTYRRKGLKGEFFRVDGENYTTRRLLILDGAKISIGKMRSDNQISRINEGIDRKLSKVPQSDQEVGRALLETGGVYDKALVTVIGDTIDKTGRASESVVRDAAESIANVDERGLNSIDVEAIKKKGIMGSILGMIIEMFQNKQTGEISPDGQSYAEGVLGKKLTPEELAKYGTLGGQFGHWLSKHQPLSKPVANYCGRNVGEAMNKFGFKGLPQSGRNGADWARICADRPDQFVNATENFTPKTAPAGAIISYERNSGGSAARQKSGHVEVALGNGKYYFGKVASSPGGSNKNFKEGSYSIWMPVSKT